MKSAASSVSSFKRDIKKHFLEKLGDVEVDIYSYNYLNPKTKVVTILELMENTKSIVSIFYPF